MTDRTPGCSIYRFGSTAHRNTNAHGPGSVQKQMYQLDHWWWYLHKWKRPYWLPMLAACQCLSTTAYQCWQLLTCHMDHNTIIPGDYYSASLHDCVDLLNMCWMYGIQILKFSPDGRVLRIHGINKSIRKLDWARGTTMKSLQPQKFNCWYGFNFSVPVYSRSICIQQVAQSGTISELGDIQWPLYFKTTTGPRKCGLILQVVLK